MRLLGEGFDVHVHRIGGSGIVIFSAFWLHSPINIEMRSMLHTWNSEEGVYAAHSVAVAAAVWTLLVLPLSVESATADWRAPAAAGKSCIEQSS